MSAQLHRTARTRQPGQALGASHIPLNRSLRLLVTGNDPERDASGNVGLAGSGILRKDSRYGLGLAGATVAPHSAPFAINTTTARSCLSIVYLEFALTHAVIAQGQGGAAGWAFYCSGTGINYVHAGVADHAIDASAEVTGAGFYTILQVADLPNNAYYAYIGKTKFGPVTLEAMAGSSAYGLSVGSSNNGVELLIGGNGNLPLAVLWERALDDREAKSLLDNPWQMLSHRRRRLRRSPPPPPHFGGRKHRLWRRQPGGHVELKPKTEFFFDFAAPSHARLVVGGGAPKRMDAGALGLRLTASNSDYLKWNADPRSIPANTPFTAFAYASLATLFNTGRLFSLRGSSGQPILGVGVGNNGQTGANLTPSYLLRDNAGNIEGVGTSVQVTDTYPHLWVCSRDAAGIMAGSFDTLPLARTNFVTVNAQIDFTDVDSAIGVDPLNTGLGYWDGTVYYAGLIIGQQWDPAFIARLVDNPWRLARRRPLLVATLGGGVVVIPPTLAYGYPIADIADGGWLNESAGLPLYPSLADGSAGVPNDATYIYSPNNPTTQEFEERITSMLPPTGGDTTYHSLNYHLQALGLDTTFTLKLVCGSTVIETWTESVTVAAGIVSRTHGISPTNAAAITDYTNLRLRGVASV